MSGTRVIVKIDPKLVNPMLHKVTDTSAKRAAQRTRDRARANIVAAGRVATGEMGRSIEIHARTVPAATSSAYTVGSSLPRTLYQEKGIGPVVARKGHVLRFKPKGSAVFIFRPRTRGFPGAHFLRDAYRALRLQDFLP